MSHKALGLVTCLWLPCPMPHVQYDSKLYQPHLRLYRELAPSLYLHPPSCLCSACCQPPSSLFQTVVFQLLAFALVLPSLQVMSCSAHKLLMPSSLTQSKRQIPYNGLQGLTGSGQLSFWPSFLFSPFLIFLQPHWGLWWSFKNSDIFLPQGLCTGCPFCLACSFPWYHMPPSLISFALLLKCYPSRENSHDYSI